MKRSTQRRLNFTGRQWIPRSRTQVEILSTTELEISFDFREMELLPDAEVILEVMSPGSSVVERMDCGRVCRWSDPSESPAAPLKKRLQKLRGPHLYFTLKVVDRTERFGRIIGYTRRIPVISGVEADEDSSRQGILPVVEGDTGEELWKLDFLDSGVFLYVSAAVPGLMDRFLHDPMIPALVYPQIVRSVLSRAIRNRPDGDEDEDRWESQWIRFGTQLHPEQEDPPTEVEESQSWIDEVVQAFCCEHRLKEVCISLPHENA